MSQDQPEWSIEDFAKEVDRLYESEGGSDFLMHTKQLLGLFQEVGETAWATTFEEVRWHLEHGQPRVAAETVLGLYGGMGSFNDLAISPVNGHKGTAAAIAVADRRLRNLRNQIHEDATGICPTRRGG